MTDWSSDTKVEFILAVILLGEIAVEEMLETNVCALAGVFLWQR